MSGQGTGGGGIIVVGSNAVTETITAADLRALIDVASAHPGISAALLDALKRILASQAPAP